MNYERIYSEFIADRLTKQPSKPEYFEKHHILPKSLGGMNGAENIVRLTARDHYFAHCCLAKLHKGKMWSALFAIANMTKTKGSSSYFLRGRMVAIARANAAQVRSVGMSSLWRLGEFKRVRVYCPHSQDIKDKIRAANVGKIATQESIDKAKRTKQSKAKRFTFVHIESNELFSGTALDFQNHSGVSQSFTSALTRGRVPVAKGWVLEGSRYIATKGRDVTVRKFLHKEGGVFIGTVYEFRTRFFLDAGVVSNLVHGKNGVKSFKGWRYSGTS